MYCAALVSPSNMLDAAAAGTGAAERVALVAAAAGQRADHLLRGRVEHHNRQLAVRRRAAARHVLRALGRERDFGAAIFVRAHAARHVDQNDNTNRRQPHLRGCPCSPAGAALDLRVAPAARAKRLVAANHQQAAPEVAHVGREQCSGLARQGALRHIH